MAWNSDKSIDWHRIHGTRRVLYPDGQLSQSFSKDVAKEYAEIFNGKIVKKNYQEK